MGVRGLSTYLQNRPEFFETKQLSNTEVIIDANNLGCFLYNNCRGLNDCFGGDYSKVYDHYYNFFSFLLNCGIRPVMIFDGGYDKSQRKLPTIRKRLSERVKHGVSCNSVSQARLRIFPILIVKLLLEVLDDLKIEYHRCSYEADEVIAHLAHTRSCPVISNDSDFYLFDVPFILLDSLNLNSVGSNDKTLGCEMFNRQKMLNHYNLYSLDLFHLVAVVIGNDYFPPHVFENIFSNIKLVTKRRDVTDRHRKIKSFLQYLSHAKSAVTVINRLVSFLPPAERDKVRTKVLNSMDDYKANIVRNIVSEDFTSHEGNQLPDWFIQEYHDGKMLNIFSISASRQYFLSVLVEPGDKVSAHQCCQDLHQEICYLVTSTDTNVHSVKAYGRVKSSLNVVFNFESEPKDYTLYTIRSLDEEVRMKMLKNILGYTAHTDLGHIDAGFHDLIMIFDFWSRKSQISNNYIKAVLMCHFLLSKVDPGVQKMRNINKIKQKKESLNAKDKLYQHFLIASKTYHLFHLEESMRVTTKKYDKDVVYNLAQFQAIFWSVQALTELYGLKLNIPKIHQLLNFTFIYNFIVFGIKEKIESQLYKAFESESELIASCLPHLVKSSEKIVSKKIQKKKISKPIEDCVEILSDSVSDASESDFSDVNNRFSKLSLS